MTPPTPAMTDEPQTKRVWWWVSVAGAPCEPAAVEGRKAWTTGCGDAFDLDEADCPCDLIEEITDGWIPYNRAEQKKAAEDHRIYKLTHHSWRPSLGWKP